MPISKSSDINSSQMRRAVRMTLLALLAFSLLFAGYILLPFIHPIILAIALAMLTYPLKRRIHNALPMGKNLNAILMVVLVVLLIVLPIFLLLGAMADQAITFTGTMSEWMNQGHLDNLSGNEYLVAVQDWVKTNIPFVDLETIDVKGIIFTMTKRISSFMVSHGAGLVGNAATTLTYFFIMMFIYFYIIRDGREMKNMLMHYSPLRAEQEERIFTKIRGVARSVLLGGVLTAICQGIVGGIGLAIVGIPGLFWGSIMGFASLIPVVGTALVWIPSVGYLLIIGSYKSAIFLTLWSILLVGSIDNFLRPFLMKGEAGMSPFYIFLSILGGVQVFGFAGLLYGPVIVAFAMVMLYIYEEEFRSILVEAHTSCSRDAAPRTKPRFVVSGIRRKNLYLKQRLRK